MARSWEPIALFDRDECAECCHHLLQRVAVVCRQRSVCWEIFPSDQILRQVRESELSRLLQYAMRPSLAQIHNIRNISNSRTNTI